MDGTFLEQLLHEEESATLDFKHDQYRFAKATDDERSELVKDLLGFVNAWRRSDAYILIGVKEVRGGRSDVVGIAEHLDDHSLQQFMTGLTNRPIRFRYEAAAFEGKQVGVVRVELQPRPCYLQRDFGKLRRNEVYVRRGSSTDPTRPALPDEIALMGLPADRPVDEAELLIEFADVERDRSLGTTVSWSAELCVMPASDDIPRLVEREDFGPLGVSLRGPYDLRLNSNYYREWAHYEFCRRLFRPTRLVITNVGQVAATDVRVELVVPAAAKLMIVDASEMPECPARQTTMLDVSTIGAIRPAHASVGDVDIRKTDDGFTADILCGSLQPGRRVWSETFHVGIPSSSEARFAVRILAANLSAPKTFDLIVKAEISERELSVDEVLALADAAEQDSEGLPG